MRESVGEYPYRLRLNFTDRRYSLTADDRKFIMSTFSGAKSILELNGAMYVGFQNYYAIQKAFTTECNHVTRRMLDPYALHVVIQKYHTLKDLETYFSRYGQIHCIVDHLSTKGRYAFVNFTDREAALKVLKDGTLHMLKGARVKVRGKVLSAAEPYSPKPYSPARLLM